MRSLEQKFGPNEPSSDGRNDYIIGWEVGMTLILLHSNEKSYISFLWFANYHKEEKML